MTTYSVYNTKTGQELEYDDFKHAESELKHLVAKEHKHELELANNWKLIMNIR